MYIGVYAYGEARFNLTFNPCKSNIKSLCPLNASVPIEASGIIPVSQQDVSGVPNIALSIPDFEGQAILRVFSNSTESQIACYSAILTNGATFSHPAAVAPVLGAVALVAFIFSVLVSMHGDSVQDTRKHYAHGVSVFMVFAVYHHIFFTGALSMNWPSVLTAFWSNYAWSAGMIYNVRMQNTINKFLGDNLGNISMVGAAPSGVDAANLGGGYSIAAIYKRATDTIKFESYDGIGQGLRTRAIEDLLSKRAEISNRSTGFSWYGNPVRPGLPLPGNYSGFPGTLARETIAVSDAFMTALLWFLILLVGIVATIVLLKLAIELFGLDEHRKTDRLAYFRKNWLSYVAAAVLRTVYIAFSMFMILTLFQLDFGGPPKIIALASVFFSLFIILMFGLNGLAAYDRYRAGKLSFGSDKLRFKRQTVFSIVPVITLVRQSSLTEKDDHQRLFGSLPWYGLRSVAGEDDEMLAHDDDKFTSRFGWLVSRYRDSRWYFPSLWLVYEFIRACFYGGAANQPLIQVFGLLAVECIALLIFIRARPFESRRLNLIMVWLLGFSKVLTVALSSAFEVRFGQDRIICTVIGVVIIVIQGGLTIVLMIAVTVGAISSYMSLKRNHEDFRPRRWINIRRKYFDYIERASKDKPAPPPPPPPPSPPIPTEPYLKVGSVTRQRKIEDDDEDLYASRNESFQVLPQQVEESDGYGVAVTPPEPVRSRAHSIRSQMSSSNLPYGARPHRASWSTIDFDNYRSAAGTPHPQPSDYSLRDRVIRQRAATMRTTAPPTFESSPRKVRSSSLRGTAPDPSTFDTPGPSNLERYGHRRQRSDSASQFFNRENITEEKETEAPDY